MRKWSVFLIGMLSINACAAPVFSRHAMVVTDQHLASQVGLNILKQGGNAIDAAAAVGYALAVVNPCCGNIGGGGFMTIHLVKGHGKNTFINFREKAPLNATETMYQDKNGRVVADKSTDGYLAVGVPGTVMGLEYALKKYGTLSRKTVMQPAIHLAQIGYKLDQGDVDLFSINTKKFSQQPNLSAIFLKNGKAYQVGDVLIQADLAKTLQMIADKGADVFYKGEIAQAVVTASQSHGGILTLKDFTDYAVQELKPITCNYRDNEIISAPPPSSGGVAICEALNILEGYPLKLEGFHSIPAMHYTIEALRFAFADRANKLGDPDFVDNPTQLLISKKYAESIRQKIPANKAVPSQSLSSKSTMTEGTHTTHYSIVDKWGNAVSVTYTLNSHFGANVMADGTGFILNNEMDDFSSKPGAANHFGLVQGKANAIASGKRPLSSMAPTIILKDNKVEMVVGSPGGPRIISATLQTILNKLDFGMNIQAAVQAGRVHQQWLPDVVYVEPDALSKPVTSGLTKMGYKLVTNQPWGAVEAIYVNPQSKELSGGSDPRRPAGLAIGY
jgi:gamma-glutamyltranspeptidase/glutathione hydrolase